MKGLHKNESLENSCRLYFWKQNSRISAGTLDFIMVPNVFLKLFLTVNLYFGAKVVEW